MTGTNGSPAIAGTNTTIPALLRHFADLRDGTHGNVTTREDKERLFAAAVALIGPYARQVLEEMNGALLLGTGSIGELATLRAIAAADMHNLVFQRDYRLVPATTRASSPQ